MRYALTHGCNVDASYVKGDKVMLLINVTDDVSLFTAGHVFEIVEVYTLSYGYMYSLRDEDGYTLDRVPHCNIVPVPETIGVCD